MYDELVKRLREASNVKYGKRVNVDRELLTQAADAIEELSAIREEQKAQIIAMAAEDKPRWIPVTEMLPEAERKSYWVCTDTGYQCECRWTNNQFGIGESDEWDWSIFDIPQYQKVVAWKPLPCPYEPPKEVNTDGQ